MWKRPNPEKVTVSESSINRRDKTIRNLIEELTSGTEELKSLIQSEGKDDRHPNPA